MRRVPFATIVLVWMLFLAVSPAEAEVRFALVIGNADYRNTTKLDNPHNDARLVAATLRKQHFDVSEHIDADLRQMRRALQAFFAKVGRIGKDAVVVVYYAGHGVQVGGANFLIPVDAEIDSESGVASDSLRADDILQDVAQTGALLKIIILDACRNNPFRGFRAVTRGLAQIEAPNGTLVAFSTAPGKVARDGPKGSNSPYTAALVKAISEPGLKIEDVFKRVRQAVNAETRGEQVPWESSSLVGDFYPAGGPSSTATPAHSTPPPLPPSNPAAEAWPHVKDSRSVAELEAFVRRFGDTYFGDLAKARLEDLKREAERQRLAMQQQQADEARNWAEAEAARERREAERQRVAALQQQQADEARNRAEAEAARERQRQNSQAEMRKPIDNLFEAWRSRDAELYAQQWEEDGVKNDLKARRRQSAREVIALRRSDFQKYGSVKVDYTLNYEGLEGGLAKFTARYRLDILVSGRWIPDRGCERYWLSRASGEWKIQRNDDYIPESQCR